MFGYHVQLGVTQLKSVSAFYEFGLKNDWNMSQIQTDLGGPEKVSHSNGFVDCIEKYL